MNFNSLNIQFIDIEKYDCQTNKHLYAEKVITKNTCTQDGESEYTCVFCNDTYKAVTPATGHDTTIIVTKATTLTDGYIRKRCKDCYTYIDTATIPKIAVVKLSKTEFIYSGKVCTPRVIIKDANGKRLIKNTDYTITYPSGRKNIGAYTVTVKFIGNYAGTESLDFEIIPSATSLSTLTKKPGAILVKWKKNTNATSGYIVQVATDKNFTKGTKKVTVKGNTKTSATVTKLKSNKRYYVRIRTYKTANGKKHYSKWSAVKSVKTK